MDPHIPTTRLLSDELRQLAANSRLLLSQTHQLLRLANLLASPLITTTPLCGEKDRTTRGEGQ